MRAALHAKPGRAHQEAFLDAMARGLQRHGVEVTWAPWNEPVACDVAVMWGWRQAAVIEAGHPVLVMEAATVHGHGLDRLDHVTIGWDGLAGRGRYPVVDDGGARWRGRYGHLMTDWTDRPDGYALVIGQVAGDAALGGLNPEAWARDVQGALGALGWRTVYRPHPRVTPPARSLAADLAGAGIVVTWSSTAAVEAVLAGVPTVALDRGSMAWDVTTHTLSAPPARPDRTAWAHRLAWCQWTREEIVSGEAWAFLRACR